MKSLRTAHCAASGQRSTRRRACFSRSESSSLMRLPAMRQALLKSSKRRLPSTSTSASLHQQIAVLLRLLVEQRHLDAAGAIIEHEAGAAVALAQLVDQSRHADLPAAALARRLRLRPVVARCAGRASRAMTSRCRSDS